MFFGKKILQVRAQTSKLNKLLILFNICRQVYYWLEKYLNLLERIVQKEGLKKDCWDLGKNFTLLKEDDGNGKNQTEKEGEGRRLKIWSFSAKRRKGEGRVTEMPGYVASI